MRRIAMLMTVVALMMVMLAMSVAPAFTHEQPCPGNGSVILQGRDSDFDPAIDSNGNEAICRYDRYDKDGSLVDTRYKDDHSHQRR